MASDSDKDKVKKKNTKNQRKLIDSTDVHTFNAVDDTLVYEDYDETIRNGGIVKTDPTEIENSNKKETDNISIDEPKLEKSRIEVSDKQVATIELKVYPNPLQQNELLTIESVIGARILVRGVGGKIIVNTLAKSTHTRVPNIAKGMYIVSMFSQGQQKNIKIVVE